MGITTRMICQWMATLALVGCATGPSEKQDLPARYRAAERALELGDWGTAGTRFHELWTEDGQSTASTLGWARALLGEGRPESALAVVEPARSVEDNPQLAAISGQAYAAIDRPVAAREAFAAALAMDSEQPGALAGLGLSLLRAGEYASAAPLLVRASKADPGAANLAREAATAAAEAGLDELELEALGSLAEAGAAQPAELLRAAELVLDAGLRDPALGSRAEAWLGRAVDLDPQAAPAWEALARLRAARGAEQLAREAYERSVQADPSAARPLLSLAQLCQSQGDTSRARSLCGHALGFLEGAEVRAPFEELLAELESSAD